MAKDPKHVRYGSRPLTREDLGPLTYLPGIMSAREDGKLQIFNEAEGGFLEVHGDGRYGYVPKEGTWMAGAKKAAFNLPGIRRLRAGEGKSASRRTHLEARRRQHL